jgi:NTE family protein
MRGVPDALQLLEAMHIVGQPTPPDRVERIVVFVVDSLSSPPTTRDRSERGPGMVDVLLEPRPATRRRHAGRRGHPVLQ